MIEDPTASADRLQRLTTGFLAAFAVAAAYVALLCMMFQPQWETNDDVGMSMIAHGYGTVAEGGPYLVFSNVIWGHLVRLIPPVGDIPGYSIATVATLAIIGAMIFWGARHAGLGLLPAFGLLALLLTRPVLFPQFTINSGLLMVAAVICWHIFARRNSFAAMIFGCALAYASFLVRSYEFALVALVAMPLIPWRAFWRSHTARAAMAALAILIALSAWIDARAYRGTEWQAFNALNPVRADFTDFGAVERLKVRPDVMTELGFSPNDVDLIGNWFFLDPKIADPRRLAAALEAIGPAAVSGDSFSNGLAALGALASPVLLPGALLAIFLISLRPRLTHLLSLGLCLAAIFFMGLAGRPGVLRVYVPLVALLIVAPLMLPARNGAGTSPPKAGMTVPAILIAALAAMAPAFTASRTAASASAEVRAALAGFPTDPVLVWGGVFPYEAVYPVLQRRNARPDFQLLGLGVFTIAPFTRLMHLADLGDGVLHQLTSLEGILVIANDERFALLAGYCAEHLGGTLRELNRSSYGNLTVSQRRCVTAEAP